MPASGIQPHCSCPISSRYSCIGNTPARAWLIVSTAFIFALLQPTTSVAQQYTIELRNGVRIGPGVLSQTDSLTTSSFQSGGSSEVGAKRIYELDDGLRATYVSTHKRTVLRVTPFNGAAMQEIDFPTAGNVVKSGDAPSIRGVIGVTEFSVYGRRQLALNSSRGRVDVLQGITKLSPIYAKVETLRWDGDQFAWDQRISPTSIPAARLKEILFQVLDETRSGDWLRIVQFYLQMERYGEAADLMRQAVERFPVELEEQRARLTQIEQQYLQQMFDELRLRRKAGQLVFAADYLQRFPVWALPLETQIEIEREVQTLKDELAVVIDVVGAARGCFQALSPEQQASVKPVFDELLDEVNLVTVARLADFQLLRRDPSIPNENLAAYIVGGWLLGQGSGIDNFAIAQSLARVRNLVREYLDDADAARRQAIMGELGSEEGAQPQLVAKILATIKPPQTAPPVQEGDPNGLVRLSATADNGDSVGYVVQLPPEYDPNQKYPCILALGGLGDSPEQTVNWWAGIPIGKDRHGHATRHGYIVVSPQWMTGSQSEYNYTEGEHDRVLCCLRDAFRKFSIDTIRVFAAGHHDGATAAWDLAVSHPDLWAGLAAISPKASKHIVHYSQNIAATGPDDEPPFGTYIVWGDRDGTLFDPDNKIGSVVTEYLKRPIYDCIVVAYRGNGRLRFGSELPKIIEWMDLAGQRRLRTPAVLTPREINARSMRPGDRFFYWLEAPQILDSAVSNPYLLDPSKRGTFEARLLDPAENAIVISKIPTEGLSAAVWLTPDMVDFNRPISLRVKGKPFREVLQPDIHVMLEDARRRGERAHVFWQRILL